MIKKGIDPTTCPPAHVVAAICSPAELAFVDALRHALDPKKVLVLAKVRALSVLHLESVADKRRFEFWRSQLAEKDFDYVICSRPSLKPVLAVELDHDTPGRRTTTRDTVLTTVAQRAQFPLIRITAAASYESKLLREKLIADYRMSKAGPLPAALA